MGINAVSMVWLGLVLGLVMVLVRLARHFASPLRLPATADWIDELSIEQYRPMLRLLDQTDLRFLRTVPGFTPQMATKFRIQRCQIFREYLRRLDNDFNRVCMALTALMVLSKDDRLDLASVLLRSRMRFASGMILVQLQLVCYQHGVGSVGAGGLVKMFDGMLLELRALVPAVSRAAA